MPLYRMPVIGLACLFAIVLMSRVEGNAMEKNYWRVEGDAMTFRSAEMDVDAELPHGFRSLRIQGHEMLAGGEGYGAVAFRRPDGTFVTDFVGMSNVAHDQNQGRHGSVVDGLFLAKVITGWSLPEFTIYAGFNLQDEHDLVLFLHPDVVAVRSVRKGSPVSTAQGNVFRGNKKGRRAKSVAVIHKSGVALHIEQPCWAGMIEAPDGKERFAVAIPCKGMAANDIRCRIDTHNRADNLMLLPKFKVDSPTMGKLDPHYRPQSHGPWSLYEKDAELDYTFTFGWLGREPFAGKAVVEARHALGKPHLRIEQAPEAQGRKKDGAVVYKATLHPKFIMPGVSEVNVHLLDGDDVVLFTQRFRIMYDWPAYQPTYNDQPDMKAFWDETLKALSGIPLAPKVEQQLFKDDPDWEFYHVSFNGWDKKRIPACLYVPKKAEKPLPVYITAHPGTRGFGVNHAPDGVFGSKIKADDRFVTIVPLIRGHEPDAKDVPFNQPWWGPLESRDEYAARSWYCAMVRALDYLATRPDLADMNRVVAKGGSQGGCLAVVTAALDPRVDLCISDCPSNAMHHDAVRPETYDTFGPSAGQVPEGQTLEQMLETLSYFDPAHMAPWVKCPTVVHVNVGDLTVHSMGGLGIYKNLTGLPDDKKWFYPGVNGHYHSGSAAGGKKANELTESLLQGEL